MALRWSFWGHPTTNSADLWMRKQQHQQQMLNPFSIQTPVCPGTSHGVHSRGLCTTVAALLDTRSISTSLNASSNLIAICGFIILMQKGGHLPADIAPVLSQVSFKLAIPSFLMLKVASTVSTHQGWAFLALPMVAFFQIGLGSILGILAGILLYPDSSTITPGEESDDYLTKKALLTTTCAFGNTITLPLVFLSGILSQSDYNTAAGYLALYMTGWSPCLWTLGYRILSSTSESPKPVASDPLHILFHWWKEIVNPPLYGVLIGMFIGATPLSFLCSPTKHNMVLLSTNGKNKLLLSACSMATAILRPLVEGARLLGSATVPLQTIVLASTVASSIGFNRKHQVLATNHQTARTFLDEKAFWASTVIRLVIMPCISLTLVTVARHRGWLPTNHLSIFVLLVVSAMPTAQNLVVMAQLRSATMPFAGALANILVRQYLLAVLSLTIWVPIFLATLGLGS